MRIAYNLIVKIFVVYPLNAVAWIARKFTVKMDAMSDKLKTIG